MPKNISEYCPSLDETLIAWLEQTYPDRLPTDPAFTLPDIQHKLGQVSVVKRLRVEYERQQEEGVSPSLFLR